VGRQWPGRASMFVALLVGIASCSTSGLTASTSSTTVQAARSSGPAVRTPKTPAGWLPVNYGDAQVSVPASWSLISEGESSCPQTPGAVILGNGAFCPPGIDASGSPSPITVSLRSSPSPSTIDEGPPFKVNGISVYAPSVAPDYVIPALHVVLDLAGDVPPQVLASLSYSPRAVVLAPGSHPSVPPTWRHQRFAGIGFAVPPNWSVRGVRDPRLPCNGLLFKADRVVLASGAPSIPSCPNEPPTLQSIQAVPGMQLESYGPGPGGPTSCTGLLRTTHGLIICIDTDPVGGVLEASVSTSRGPVFVTLGLAGNGQVARTVFNSMVRS
jgi:hypothetical protein